MNVNLALNDECPSHKIEQNKLNILGKDQKISRTAGTRTSRESREDMVGWTNSQREVHNGSQAQLERNLPDGSGHTIATE